MSEWGHVHCELNLYCQLTSPYLSLSFLTKDLFDSYNCSCIPGFYGPHCEYEHNECAPRPCQNNGSCKDLVNGYSCNCTSGYTGRNCEVEREVDIQGVSTDSNESK